MLRNCCVLLCNAGRRSGDPNLKPGIRLMEWKTLCKPTRKMEPHAAASLQRVFHQLPSLRNFFQENLLLLFRQLTLQCEFIAAMRLRRAYQMWTLHSRLYNETRLKVMIANLGRRWLLRQRPFGILLGAAAAFSWEKDGISDEEITSCLCDLAIMEQLTGKPATVSNKKSIPISCREFLGAWEQVVTKDNLKVWRRNIPENPQLFEYRVFGTYTDVSPRAFFSVQVDTDYRKKWDDLVVKLSVIDQTKKKGSCCEVVHWEMHYPYPMANREYVYVRRYMIDPENNVMILVSRAVDHPKAEPKNNVVRVNTYNSRMIIKPHSTFDKEGFDYVLTYLDDPKAVIPSRAYNWMATTGVAEFLEKLHKAATKMRGRSLPECVKDASPIKHQRITSSLPQSPSNFIQFFT